MYQPCENHTAIVHNNDNIDNNNDTFYLTMLKNTYETESS